MKSLLLFIAVPALLIPATIFSSAPTFAQSPVCSNRAQVLEQLSAEYAESVVARGLTVRGAMLEITATSDGGTWTIIVTVPGGPTCLVAAGDGWQTVEQKPRGRSM